MSCNIIQLYTIYWVIPLPSNSHHPDYSISSRESLYINLHLPQESWEGGQPKLYINSFSPSNTSNDSSVQGLPGSRTTRFFASIRLNFRPTKPASFRSRVFRLFGVPPWLVLGIFRRDFWGKFWAKNVDVDFFLLWKPKNNPKVFKNE